MAKSTAAISKYLAGVRTFTGLYRELHHPQIWKSDQEDGPLFLTMSTSITARNSAYQNVEEEVRLECPIFREVRAMDCVLHLHEKT